MIKKITFIMLVFLSQTFSANSNPDFSSVSGNDDFADIYSEQERNWRYFNGNLPVENGLPSLPSKIGGFYDLDINAKAAIVLDSGTDRVLYSKNQDEKRPIASLTKIMTALVVLENSDPEEIAVVSQKAFDTEGAKNNLIAGERITVKNLMKLMLIESNNPAAVSLAEHVSGSVEEFVNLMNHKAELLGLYNTRFSNPTGLDQQNGNYSSAYEVSQLADYSLKEKLIWEILKTRSERVFSSDGKISHWIKNTNVFLGKLNNIEGGKTGFTDEAGGCFLFVIGEPKSNHKIISVILDSEDRFFETKKLVDFIFESYEW